MHSSSISTAAKAVVGAASPVLGLCEPYADNWEYLAAELARLDLIIQACLARDEAPAPPDSEPESLRGLYLSGAEVRRLLGPSAPDSPEVHQLLAQVRAMDEEIAARCTASLATGVPLRLPMLSRLFGLTEWEERLLVVCLAPTVDPRYEKFYAYLNDDLARKGPTLHLAATLLFGPLLDQPAEGVRARAALAATSRPFHAGLLHMLDEEGAASHMACMLRLDQRIANFLLGLDDLPARVEAFAQFAGPQPASADAERVLRLAAAVQDHLGGSRPTQGRRLLVHLSGPPGTGRRAMAEAVCARLATPLVVIDLEELSRLAEPFEPALRLAAREALLQPAALYFEGFDRLNPAPGAAPPDAPAASPPVAGADHLGALLRAVEDFSWLTFVAGERPFTPSGRWREHIWLPIQLAAPDTAGRADLWLSALTESGVQLAPSEVDALAGRFRLTGGQIRAALRAAGDEAHLRPPDQRQISAQDLARACRQQAAALLPGLAQRIEPLYRWPDIVLPASALAQLHEMCAQVRHRRTVFGTWGFGAKLARGKGLAALFSGPSGTGKTMAAEIIAGDLELDLYRIDLSTVVSKYIGETEKNLSPIFAEAEHGSAVLFFDEADALFGKRSEVKDAHDRYANIEISYLLQRMESYEGVVILATNLKKNMDEAFMRRLQFIVEFPFPDAAQRRRIWEGLFPAPTLCSVDVDFDFLAERLALAGGNIKNVVLHAAFLAAAEGEKIGMRHLMCAARREYDKIDRLGAESDFGPYWPLVKAEEERWKS